MRLGTLILIYFAFAGLATAQRPFASNLWSSFIFNCKLNQWGIVADAGFRWCDHFIQSERTGLARVTVDRNLTKNHRLGLGYAYFEHYNDKTSFENRFYLQYSKGINLKHSNLNFRFRNELRTFNDRNSTNRMRGQISWLKEHTKYLGTQLSAEIFYTPGKPSLLEQRYTIGLNATLSEQLKLVGFYIGQLQSNVNYLQHIIGLQVQVIIEPLSRTKTSP